MTPDQVLAMPVGMRRVFEQHQAKEIRAANKQARRR